jgi:antitoxin component of RelBE/YafQ-DinJ toxin-antitoxin module
MLSTLDNDIKEKITLAYFKMGRANVLVKGVLNSSLPFEARLREKNAAWSAVKDSRVPIEEAHSALTRSSSQTIGET